MSDAKVFEWRDGGSETLKWTNSGRDWWAAVWPNGKAFSAWVSGPRLEDRQVLPHADDERTAIQWCERLMPPAA